jgi:hypothetical protein
MKALPVLATAVAGTSVFLLFGGITATENSGRYACPMLCVVLDAPGVCPVCGMELEQLAETGDTIIVSDTGTTLAGLGSVEVTARNLKVVRSFSARVTVTSESVFAATSWVEGRITDLRITGRGELVEQDQILAVLHSPQALSARADYNAAVLSGDQFLVNAASDRLQEFGIHERGEGNFPETAYILSPVSGIVDEIYLNSGAWVRRGTTLAMVVETTGRELCIDVPENIAALLETGLNVSASLPGRIWKGSVDRIEPRLNPGTLTLSAYVSLPDSVPVIPGSIVPVEVEFSQVSRVEVSVPERSVLMLGARSVVYIDLGDARYIPREVRVGVLSYDDNSKPFYPVIEGVLQGERVVEDGVFLLDSQAELAGITSLLNAGDTL